MLLLLACAAEQSPADNVPATGLAAAFEALSEELPRLHGAVVLESYEQAAAGRTESCPSAASGGHDIGDHDVDQWSDDCVTDGGARFVGTVSSEHFSGRDLGLDDFRFEGDGIFATASIATVEGSWYGAGVARAALGTREGGDRLWASLVQGVFAWSGGSAWLAGGWSADLELLVLDGEPRTLSVDGGIGVPGGAVSAVRFRELWLAEDCSAEPSGSVAVRDGEGAWHELTLDCEGCGTLADAEVCVDLQPFWEQEEPW